VTNAWLKTPRDELIPLTKHMFDYTIRTILYAAFDFSCDDEQTVASIHESYDIVSCSGFLCLLGGLSGAPEPRGQLPHCPCCTGAARGQKNALLRCRLTRVLTY